MAKHHLTFTSFHPGVLTVTNELFNGKPWRLGTDAEKREAGQLWVDRVAAILEVPSFRLTVGDSEDSLDRAGSTSSDRDPLAYDPDDEDVPDDLSERMVDNRPVVHLEYWSLIQLFKAFRKHMVGSAYGLSPSTNQRDDIFGWACSLFYTVRPAMFQARVREGRIQRIRPEEVVIPATTPTRAVPAQADDNARSVPAGINLDSMNRDALRATAKQVELVGRGSMTASQLREALRQLQERV